MSIIVTNEITVPEERAAEVTEKFIANSQRLSDFDGFEGFELCRPTSPADQRWLVITRWRDEQAYAAWREGSHFQRSHQGQSQTTPEQSQRPETASSATRGAASVVRHYSVAVSR